MMACVQGSGPGRPQRAVADVVSLDRAAIQRALAARHRYKYVQPRVEPEGDGWKVVSPNCSRSVDADGGDIAIAWLRRGKGGWTLYARDHRLAAWLPKLVERPLTQALVLLCEDPNRDFWQ